MTESDITTGATNPPSRAASVFYDDTHLTILNPRAVSRVTAALQAIESLSGMLYERHEKANWDDGEPDVHPLDIRGLLSGISVCAEFVSGHINGGGMDSHYAVALESDDAGFEQIQQLTNQARDLQITSRDKRRLEALEGHSQKNSAYRHEATE